MKVISSPLRYIGGKKWLFRKIEEHIPDGTTEMVSPFFGGGAVELNLAYRGVRVHGYDVCPYLLNFWQHWQSDPGGTERRAKAILAKHTREELIAIKRKSLFTGEAGAVFYYLCNRLAFGGQTLQHSHIKKYEKVNGRYVYPLYKTQTRRRYVFPHSAFWETFPPVPLTIGASDFKVSLSRHPSIFALLDPPYVEKEYFYRLDSFDHLGLSEILKARKNWILCYNDHPFVSDLYRGYERLSVKGRNFNTGKKTTAEVIIFSHDIVERLEYQQQYLCLF